MRREFPEAARLFAPGFQNWYWRQSRLGYVRPRPALTQLRVKTPLMLLHGLRSCEVLALNREDVQLSDLQIRVQGKGKRIRVLPLARESCGIAHARLCCEIGEPGADAR